MSNLDIAIRKQVPTVPQALKALAAMERQLTAAKTYEDLRRVIKEASALKVLMNDVAEVKAAAENAILLGNKRIAEELRKVPKAGGPGRGKRLPPQGYSLSGKAATGIKHSMRSRLGKLADKSDAEIRATADRLREQGKDATPTAVVRELTHGNKAERRAQRERDLSAKILARPEKKYGAVREDYEWDHETWSERRQGPSRQQSLFHQRRRPHGRRNRHAHQRTIRLRGRRLCAVHVGDVAISGRRNGCPAAQGLYLQDDHHVGQGRRRDRVLVSESSRADAGRYARQCSGACARYAMAKRDR